jgi:calcium-dependent protein kinase
MGAVCTPTKKKEEKSANEDSNKTLQSPEINTKNIIVHKKDNTSSVTNSPFRLDKTVTGRTRDSICTNRFTWINTIILNQIESSPLEKFEILKPIGEGSYGKVYLVQENGTNTQRAMKEIGREKQKTKKSPNSSNVVNNENDEVVLRTEIEVLKNMDHPNIIKIFEFYTTPDKFYLITEYYNNSTLLQHIQQKKKFSEEQTAFILFQILSAVNYLHFNKIIHRDIKPENIIITRIENENFHLKLIDFGCCKDILKHKKDDKLIGSTYYLAPEVFTKKYCKKCDIWSVGVIFYILLCGEMPFYGETEEEVAVKIQRSDYDMKPLRDSEISKEAKQLIKLMLEKEIDKRVTASKALKHSFFKRYLPKDNLIMNIEKIKKENIKNYWENVINFKPTFKIQYVSLLNIVHHLIPFDEDVEEIQQLFYLFDEKNNGCLTMSEIKTGFQKLLKEEFVENDYFFQYLDCNKKGFVQFKEFAIGCLDKSKHLSDEIIRKSFQKFDVNNCGKITLDKLREKFGKRKDLAENTINEIINEFKNQECFNYDEYKYLLLRLSKH